jgi:hypothetical protein
MLLSFKKWLEANCSAGGTGNAMGSTGSIAVKANPLDAQRRPALHGVSDPEQDQDPPVKKIKTKIVNHQVQS